MDAIHAARTPHRMRGIVHSVSYARAAEIRDNSRFKHRMIVHKDSRGLPDALAELASRPDGILVSPSIHTGYNFPFDAAEYQIIAKHPHPDTRDPIAKARIEKNPMYAAAMQAATVTQSLGRLMRDAKDRGESFLVDRLVAMHMFNHKQFYPQYLLKQYCGKIEREIPPPPVRQF